MRKARPFEGLPDGLLDSILQSGTVRTCLNGELLIGQGDTPEHMLLVLDGQLRTFMTGEDGNEVTLRMLDPGASCMGVASQRPHPSASGPLRKAACHPDRFAENMLRIAAANYRGVIEQIRSEHLPAELPLPSGRVSSGSGCAMADQEIDASHSA